MSLVVAVGHYPGFRASIALVTWTVLEGFLLLLLPSHFLTGYFEIQHTEWSQNLGKN